MIDELANGNPGEETRRCHAAVNDRGWNGGGYDRLALAAVILRANMLVYKKPCWLDIQLFGDIFANFNEIVAALGAAARFWFVTVHNALQMFRQRLSTGARTFGFWRRNVDEHIDLRFQFGKIGFPGFLKQVALFC